MTSHSRPGTSETLAMGTPTALPVTELRAAVCKVAEGPPLNGVIEIGGPQQFGFDDFVRHALGAYHDARQVVADPHARYFGTELGERSLVPGADARLGALRFDDWLTQSKVAAATA